MFLSSICRRLTRSSRSVRLARPGNTRLPLLVEPLEDRKVLSVWTGSVNVDWHNPDNWLGGVPEEGGTAIFNRDALGRSCHISTPVTVSVLEIQQGWDGGIGQEALLTVTTSFSMASGSIMGSQDLILAGASSWTGGSIAGSHAGTGRIINTGTLAIDPVVPAALSRSVVNQSTGRVIWTGSSDFYVPNGFVFDNYGEFEAQNNRTFYSFCVVGASATFNNMGIFRKSIGDGTTTFSNCPRAGDSMLFNNHGTVEVLTGTLNLNGGEATGAFQAEADAEVLFTSDYHLNAGAEISGPGRVRVGRFTLFINSAVEASNLVLESSNGTQGNLKGVGSLTISSTMTWRGVGEIWVPLTIQEQATLEISGSGDRVLVRSGFTNSGTVNWLSADIVLQSGATWTNAHDVFVEPGLLRFVGNYAQTGGLTNVKGSTLTVTSLLDIQGGTLSGWGTIIGNVRNAGLLEVGGAESVESLTINGNYTQTATGRLRMEIAGLASNGAHDYLYVTQTAALAGTLEIALLDNFMPPLYELYTLMNFGVRSGDFTAFNGLNASDDVAFYPFCDDTGYYLWTDAP